MNQSYIGKSLDGSSRLLGLVVDPNDTIVNNLVVQSTKSSGSSTTGAIVVTGGVGIGGNLNVAGTITGGSITYASTSTGTLSVTNTTDSTSTGTGVLLVSGGVGIDKNVNIGGTLSTQSTLNVGALGSKQYLINLGRTGGGGYRNAYIYGDAGGSISFWNQDATGYMLFGTSNVERIRITDTGCIGFGVTSPTQKLEIASLSSTLGAFIVLDSTAGVSGRKYLVGSSLSGNATGAGNFEIYDGTSNQTRFIINSSGNVGIGSTSPSEKLVVAGKILVDDATNATLQLKTGVNTSNIFTDNTGITTYKSPASSHTFQDSSNIKLSAFTNGGSNIGTLELNTGGNLTKIYTDNIGVAMYSSSGGFHKFIDGVGGVIGSLSNNGFTVGSVATSANLTVSGINALFTATGTSDFEMKFSNDLARDGKIINRYNGNMEIFTSRIVDTLKLQSTGNPSNFGGSVTINGTLGLSGGILTSPVTQSVDTQVNLASTTTPALKITNQHPGNADNVALAGLTANLDVGRSTSLAVGRSLTSNNCMMLTYNYQSTSLDTEMSMNLYGASDSGIRIKNSKLKIGAGSYFGYQESTFTPTVSFPSGRATVDSYAVQNGFYTKIGRQATVSVIMDVTCRGDGDSFAGDIPINVVLPFTPAYQFRQNMEGLYINTNMGSPIVQWDGSNCNFGNYYSSGGGTNNMNFAEGKVFYPSISTTRFIIRFTVTYITA